MEVGDLLAVLGLLQVDGEESGDAGDGPPGSVDRDPLAADEGVVDAPDSLDGEVSLIWETMKPSSST